MMELDPPGVCGLASVDDAVQRAIGQPHEHLFAANRVEWRARVARYLADRGDPVLVPRWDLANDNGDVFRDLYDKASKLSVSGRYIHDLKEHELALCPACGAPGRPNTREHYLPQARWPHFAATPANIYPMCSTCQGHKGSRTGNPRYFIHPYFDRFSVPKIVVLTILPPFDAPTFELAPNGALTAQEQALVETHVEELKIDERFITFFKTDYRRLLRSVRKLRNGGADVDANLEALAEGSEYPTVNGWQHLFYASVVATPALMEYLREGALPDLL